MDGACALWALERACALWACALCVSVYLSCHLLRSHFKGADSKHKPSLYLVMSLSYYKAFFNDQIFSPLL